MESHLIAYGEKKIQQRGLNTSRSKETHSHFRNKSPHRSREGDFKLNFVYSWQNQKAWKQPQKSKSTAERLTTWKVPEGTTQRDS